MQNSSSLPRNFSKWNQSDTCWRVINKSIGENFLGKFVSKKGKFSENWCNVVKKFKEKGKTKTDRKFFISEKCIVKFGRNKKINCEIDENFFLFCKFSAIFYKIFLFLEKKEVSAHLNFYFSL